MVDSPFLACAVSSMAPGYKQLEGEGEGEGEQLVLSLFISKMNCCPSQPLSPSLLPHCPTCNWQVILQLGQASLPENIAAKRGVDRSEESAPTETTVSPQPVSAPDLTKIIESLV